MTFYAMLNSKPMGKHIIQVCKSTTYHVNKSKEIVKIFEQRLGIKIGKTTKDGIFTLILTNCIEACNISPSAKIDEEVFGNLSREKIGNLIKIQGKRIMLKTVNLISCNIGKIVPDLV